MHCVSVSPSVSSEKRIGILTGGGDCPGLNAVIRAACTTCRRFGFEVIGFKDGFEGLLTEKHVALCCNKVEGLHSIGGTILGTTNKGSYGFPLAEEIVKQSVETYTKLNLSCLICIGGDGTMSIAHELSKTGIINVVGVPKTIDNDLMATDVTFGHNSAVSIVSEALDRLHTTACSHHRVIVVEVMGRNSGWIALNGGVAGGASIILIPEIEWEWEPIYSHLRNRATTLSYSIIVVAEGASLPGGTQVGVDFDETKKETDRIRLGGIGKIIADKIEKDTGLETRVTVLGHIQRGGSPTSYDRILATTYGSVAAKLACEGHYDQMASLRGTTVVSEPLTEKMKDQKKN